MDDTVVVYLRRVAQIAISLEVNAEGVVEVRLPPEVVGLLCLCTLLCKKRHAGRESCCESELDKSLHVPVFARDDYERRKEVLDRGLPIATTTWDCFWNACRYLWPDFPLCKTSAVDVAVLTWTSPYCPAQSCYTHSFPTALSRLQPLNLPQAAAHPPSA